jgi:subtilisin-like proprotein convertase family protein
MDSYTAAKRIALSFAIIICSGFSAVAGSVHTYAGSFNLLIPANPDSTRGWTDDAIIDVPDHFTISDIDVRITLTHTNVFDLQIFLKSPAGNTICLNMYNYDEFFVGANYTNTIFDDEASLSIKEGEAPFTGRFKPREPYCLSAFDGQDCFGAWRLQIYDAFYFDTGRLNSFELIITAAEPAMVAVPDVVGMTRADAASAIISAGLVVGVITQQHSDVLPPGYVLSQSPGAAVPVVAESPVDLVLSCGPLASVVPPTVMTLAPTDVGRKIATLQGLVLDDGGEPCQYRFTYWTWGFWCCTGWSDPADCKTTGELFCQQQTGLTAGTYYFSAQAKNSAGEGSSADVQTFTIRGFTGSGCGTEDDPYIITNACELQQIERDLTACYELASDIDASVAANWNDRYGFTPIGRYTAPFEGVFDGKGHVITGLDINWPCICVGLFGCTGGTSEIRNLGLSDVTVTGYACVGGLVGFNGGAIEACYVSGNVSGSTQVGGLVGTNNGLVTDSYSVANVSGPQQESCIGGLVGVNRSGPLKNCYSAGKVGGENSGGLAGTSGGECTGCFWDIETSGRGASACGIGKTTAEMQTWATFAAAGWSAEGGWTLCEHTGYPKLTWQIRPGDEFCPDGVDMLDFVLFAARWKAGKPDASGDGGDSADLNQSGTVNATDLEILTSGWLTGGK